MQSLARKIGLNLAAFVLSLSATAYLTAETPTDVRYRVIALGFPEGFDPEFDLWTSEAHGINECGQVVGRVFVDAFDERAFVWVPTPSSVLGLSWREMADISPGGCPPQAGECGNESAALEINDFGVVVGSITPAGTSDAHVWVLPSGVNATLDEDTIVARSVDDGCGGLETVVGEQMPSTCRLGLYWFTTNLPDTTVSDLDPARDCEGFGMHLESTAFDVEDRCVPSLEITIVGSSNLLCLPEPDRSVGTVWRLTNTFAPECLRRPLIAGSWEKAEARGLNPQQEIVGFDTNFSLSAGATRAMYWSGPTAPPRSLHVAPLAEGDVSMALSINSGPAGQIVGHADNRAALWEVGGFGQFLSYRYHDLNCLIAPTAATRWTLKCATDISDRGWIVGYGDDLCALPAEDPEPRAFVMIPIDDCYLADVDGDCEVTQEDLNLIAANQGPCDICDACALDINGDGVVDQIDIDLCTDCLFANVCEELGSCELD